MRARDVMTTKLHTAREATPVSEIAVMMLEHRISGVPIVDDGGGLVGLVTESDLLRRPETGGEKRRAWWLKLLSEPGENADQYVRSHGRHARDVMTRKVVTAREEMTAPEIADLMQRHAIKRMPVLRDGKLVGIVSRVDLLRALAAQSSAGPQSVDDTALRKAVEAALHAEDWVRSEYVTVEVHGGAVRLGGLVSDSAQKRALRVLLEGIAGVKSFHDETVVRPRNLAG